MSDPEMTALERACMLVEKGDNWGAIPILMEAIASESENSELYKFLGDCLFRLNQLERAIIAYKKAMSVGGDSIGVCTNLGACYQKSGEHEKALCMYRKVLNTDSGNKHVLNNIGLIRLAQKRFSDAAHWFNKSIRSDPNWTVSHINMAISLSEQQEYDLAEGHYHKVLELDPHYAEAHLNLGMLALLRGDFVTGWKEYSWRLRALKFGTQSIQAPLWEGAYEPSKVLLVHAEQGIGDTIQFARYFSQMRSMVRKVIFLAPASLLLLLEGVEGVDHFIAEGDEVLPPFDYRIPLMNVVSHLWVDEASIPGRGGYLTPTGEKPAVLAELLGRKRTRMRVGIAWAGNPLNSGDWRRSCSFEELEPLFSDDLSVDWYSLQKGEAENDPQSFEWARKLNCIDDVIQDLNGTAHLMKSLDLVVTVDTAMVHLAGSLGVPTWLMLASVADWRWMLGRTDSIWYDSVRIFRQTSLGDWGSVVQLIKRSLVDKL